MTSLFTTFMSSTAWRATSAALLVAAIALWIPAGCATLHPPLAEPPHGDTLSITPLRADPDGLTLQFGANTVAPDIDHTLQIWRRTPHSDWSLLQSIDIDTDLAAALRTSDVQWTDDLDDQPRRLEYRLRLVGNAPRLHSAPLTVDWPGLLEPPSLRADTDCDGQALLQWSHHRPLEARVLRRDVVADTDFSPVGIVDAAAGGRFIDSDTRPGAVYAYQIQFVDRRQPIPVFSRWTEPLYVSIPET